MEIEAFREPTQADWDAVFAAACRKHKEICELQAVLRDHGIPLPPGHKDRAGEL
jgi:hypothetical protein